MPYPKRRKKLTPARKLTILRLRCEGKTFRQIQLISGINFKTASKYCKGLHFFVPKGRS